MTESSSLLQTHQLDVSIGNVEVCKSLDWTIKRGEHWGILGLNGIGKTTLLNTLAGLHKSFYGNIKVLGKEIKTYTANELAVQIAYLLQSMPHDFPMSVEEFCQGSLNSRLGRWQLIDQSVDDLINEALRGVQMETFKQRTMQKLSGGERRRIEIAGVLLQDPTIWLLDEPTNHLDLHQQRAMMKLLIDHVNTNNGCSISILHDPNLAVRYCTHILLLQGNGQWQLGNRDDMLTTENLSQLYQHKICKVTDNNGTLFIAE